MDKKPDDSLEKESEDQAKSDLEHSLDSLETSEEQGNEAKPIVDQPSGNAPKPFRSRYRSFSIYLLAFLLILVVMAIGGTAYYFNNTGDGNQQPKLSSQPLSTDALKQLSNSDVTVGESKEVLTVQSNAIFDGSVLLRGNVEVAGKLVVGDKMTLQGLNVGGQSTFEDLNVSHDLAVTHDAAVQGKLTASGGLTVNGETNFSGGLSVSQLNVNNLVLNGTLTLSHHLAGSGGKPSRSSGNALGSGGTSSVNGSDLAGTVNINTGNSPSAGCFITVNFASSYGSTPHVVVTPIGSSAGSLDWYVNRSSSNFSICSNNAAPSGKSFAFDYVVIG